jgi:hypothetical protein
MRLGCLLPQEALQAPFESFWFSCVAIGRMYLFIKGM